MVTLYNTASKQKEAFGPLSKKKVGIYSCGPTVYDFAHIGNLRSFLFSDLLRRMFEYEGYRVNQVMNITDVGHLVTDGDEGEDKMTKGLKREGKPITLESMKELANFYADKFVEDIHALNILKPSVLPKASEHIEEQIEILKKLDGKGYLYITNDGVYFDTTQDPNYGKLGGIKELIASGNDTTSRVEENPEKRNPRDFAVWKFNNQMGWESPWGQGFPGWHIECSAMSMKYLGETFDIHTGGVDHIDIHHNNEIAQSENATGKTFARFWMHGAFLNINDAKMAKSGENFITLETVRKKGFDPLVLRYFLLQSHYRSQANFTWEALGAAETALDRLRAIYLNLSSNVRFWKKLAARPDKVYKERFCEAITDDLDIPKALALTWELVKDDRVAPAVRRATLLNFDQVLGFDLHKLKRAKRVISAEIQKLLDERALARKNKEWQKSDYIRNKLKALGVEVKDTDKGQEITG